MGKNKKANKEALEFVVVNRAIDDPHGNDPNAPSKILLHVPKEGIDESTKQKHEKLMNQIPEISRGVYNEDAIQTKLKEMGIKFENGDMSQNELFDNIDSLHKDDMIKRVKMDMTKNELIKYQKGSKIVPVEEIIETDLAKLDIYNLDDKNIDQIFKRSKIDAKFVEYNEFGLQTSDPEVLQYVTKKEFVEGVDIFIPAPNMTYENRYDIDIQPEDMDEEYKAVYDAMRSDDEGGEELEDNFILLANEGEAPVKIDNTKREEEIVVTQTKPTNNEPSYKFITKEEKEYLDKKFNSTYDKYYKNNDEPKINYASKQVFQDAISELTGKKDEEEFEEYEEFEDFEDEEELEQEDGEFKNNLIVEKKEEKQFPKKKKDFGDNVHQDIDKITHDKQDIEKTIELYENQPQVNEEDEEGYPEYYVNKKLDITSATGTHGNIPKTIAYDKPFKPKKAHKEEDKTITVTVANKPIDITNEEKDEKKLRKKLLKEEKREKRVEKKNLKKAFTVK
jgi:hypothetical protein